MKSVSDDNYLSADTSTLCEVICTSADMKLNRKVLEAAQGSYSLKQKLQTYYGMSSNFPANSFVILPKGPDFTQGFLVLMFLGQSLLNTCNIVDFTSLLFRMKSMLKCYNIDRLSFAKGELNNLGFGITEGVEAIETVFSSSGIEVEVVSAA